MLSAFLIDHFKNTNSTTFYFTFESKFKDKSAHVAVVRSLVYQLYIQLGTEDEKFIRCLIQHRDQGSPDQSRDPWVLWDIFCGFIGAIPNPLLILDGLDECDSPSVFLGNVKALASEKAVRVIIVSRRTSVVMEELNGYSSLQFGEAELQHDILIYAEAEISKSSKLCSEETHQYFQQQLGCPLAVEISKRSNGSFLWASLILKEIVTATYRSDMIEMLHETPSDLSAIYEKILDRLASNVGARRRNNSAVLVKWIACAARPLSMDEARAAPIVGPKGAPKVRDSHDNMMLSEQELERACGSLVLINNGRVRLAHATIRDFLQNPPKSSKDNSCIQDFLIDWREENLLIADHCIYYMNSSFEQYTVKGNDDKRRSEVWTIRRSKPLLEYAVFHWLYHLIESRVSFRSELDIGLPQFLQTAKMLCWLEMWFTIAPDSLWRLRHLIKTLQGYYRRERELSDNTPLVLGWADAMAELLDRHGPSLEDNSSHIHSIDPTVFVEEPGEGSFFSRFTVPDPACYIRQIRLTPTMTALNQLGLQALKKHNSDTTFSTLAGHKPFGMFYVEEQRQLILIVEHESILPTLRCQQLNSGLELAPVFDRQRPKGYYRWQAHSFSPTKDHLAVLFWGLGGNFIIVWKIPTPSNSPIQRMAISGLRSHYRYTSEKGASVLVLSR